MTVKTIDAARLLCDLSNWKLTNLELQKLLYLSHMYHLGEIGEPLIHGRFEAWDYGPVEPSLYRRVKMFGSDQIEDVFLDAAEVSNASSEYKSTAEVYSALAGRKPGALVAETHWENGAWAKVYVPNAKNIQIPDELILDEYKARGARAKQRSVSAA